MILWSSNKAAFKGGSKTLIKGLFYSSVTVTSEAPEPVEDSVLTSRLLKVSLDTITR